jgi:H+-translocating NAD(P) transhydrogenase subunit alpha
VKQVFFHLIPCFYELNGPNKGRGLIENKLLLPGALMMGFLDPFDVDHENHMANWQMLGITTISLELLHLAADDPKNAQAAMSRFAGRLALQDALQQYQGVLPKKVTVFGTGPAALSAAVFARNLQLPVKLFGRHEHHRQTIEANGIAYYVLPETDQSAFIRKHLSNETIIITAARSVGKRSPLLIDAAGLAALPERAVVVDLSTGEGGNVLESKEDQVIIVDRDISIINVSGYPKTEPKAASETFAQCIANLLLEVMVPGEIHLENPLLSQS